MRLLLAAICVVFSLPSSAMNWQKCKQKVLQDRKMHSNSKNIGRAFGRNTMYSISEYSTNASTSATSYVTSTGPCAAIGMAEQKRLNYIVETQNELQRELAEGRGEYVTAMATLYGCNEIGRAQFGRVIKDSYSKIFSSHLANGPLEVAERMTDSVSDSNVLGKNCNLELI